MQQVLCPTDGYSVTPRGGHTMSMRQQARGLGAAQMLQVQMLMATLVERQTRATAGLSDVLHSLDLDDQRKA